jgi:hypothetical protein
MKHIHRYFARVGFQKNIISNVKWFGNVLHQIYVQTIVFLRGTFHEAEHTNTTNFDMSFSKYYVTHNETK